MKLEDRFCTLCGPTSAKSVKYVSNFSENDLNAAIFSARRAPDKRHFRLVECETCGLIYSDPAANSADLATLYKEAGVTYDDQEAQIYDSYAPVLDRAMRKLKKRATFLEIGGGRGFMLRYGVENGFASEVEIEPSADAEKKFVPASPQSRFIRGIFTRNTLAPSSVSLACFFQMLDHVPGPSEFLENVFEVLEPGGVAVCVTHDTGAFSAKVLGERSPIFDIEHTYLFNQHNLSSLFTKTGFEQVTAFSVPNRYSLNYWMHLFPLPRNLKGVALSALRALRLADRRLNLYAGNFAVIAVKPGRS